MRCSPRSGFDIFLVFEAWFTKMDVHIYEAGRYDKTSCIKYWDAFFGNALSAGS